MATLTISEKTTGGGTDTHTQVFMPERITVRKLIRLYIDHQIEEYENETTDAPVVRSYFIPSKEEQDLNGSRPARARTPLDAEKLHERALSAFSNNEVILLVDEQQVDHLDQELLVRVDSTVTFLRLMPLVGG
jgi:hypothetical protein